MLGDHFTDAGVITHVVHAPRQNLLTDTSRRRSRFDGNLPLLGNSLNVQQTTAMVVTEDRPNANKFRLWDGYRRLLSVDRGYAQRFAKRNRFKLLVVQDDNGGPASDAQLRQLCATTPQLRDTWSPLEEAKYYQSVISQRLKEFLLQKGLPQLEASVERSLRRATIDRLAALEGRKSGQTVRNRLKLLELPDIIQDQLERGNLSADAAFRLEGVSPEEAEEVLNIAAGIDGIDLAGSQLPGDLLVEPLPKKKRLLDLGDDSLVIPSGASRIRAATIDTAKRQMGLAGKKVATKLRPTKEIRDVIAALTDKIVSPDDPDAKALKALRWALGESDTPPLHY